VNVSWAGLSKLNPPHRGAVSAERSDMKNRALASIRWHFCGSTRWATTRRRGARCATARPATAASPCAPICGAVWLAPSQVRPHSRARRHSRHEPPWPVRRSASSLRWLDGSGTPVQYA
jgi:hypothetical protein